MQPDSQGSAVGWLRGPRSSTASLCVDVVQGWWVHWGPRIITNSPGVGRAKQKLTLAYKGLFWNCLPPAKESKQVSVFFQPKGLFFFPSLAPLAGNWFSPAPPVLIHAICAQHWARGFPPSSCRSQHCSLCTSKPKQAPREGLLPCEWAVLLEQWFCALVWVVIPTCLQNRAQTNLCLKAFCAKFKFSFQKLQRKLLLFLFVLIKMVASFGVSLWRIVLQQVMFLHSATSPLPTLSLHEIHVNHDLVDFSPSR